MILTFGSAATVVAQIRRIAPRRVRFPAGFWVRFPADDAGVAKPRCDARAIACVNGLSRNVRFSRTVRECNILRAAPGFLGDGRKILVAFKTDGGLRLGSGLAFDLGGVSGRRFGSGDVRLFGLESIGDARARPALWAVGVGVRDVGFVLADGRAFSWIGDAFRGALGAFGRLRIGCDVGGLFGGAPAVSLVACGAFGRLGGGPGLMASHG